MSVETATYINTLNTALPASGDAKSEGDDHLRLIKSAVKATFPNVTGAVTPTHSDLNIIAGAATGSVSGLNVATQTASDNTTKAASTAMVQSAILASSGISASLPAQTGNAGKVLTTNGTAASWGSVVGIGGATSTGSVTLTASSPAAQSVAPTSYGQTVTLPDATTCAKGVPLFGIYNSGSYPVSIQTAGGVLLGFVAPLKSCVIALAGNATSEGVWNLYGADMAGTDAQGIVSFAGAVGTALYLTHVNLDSARDLLILSGSTAVYAVVYDNSAKSFGSPALVRTANVADLCAAIKSATDQALVVTCDQTTGLQAVALSFSGTTITVNTAATATLAGNAATFTRDLVPVGSAWILGYTRATTVAGIRALTISGTTVTIGAEAATTGTSIAPVIYDMGSSVAMVLSQTTNITAAPYTVSGTTLTPGTAATITATAAGFLCRSLPSGRIALLYLNTNNFGAVVSLSGTTATSSAVQLAAAAGTNLNALVQIGNQCIACASTATDLYVNVLTDSAGTAVAGTEINYSFTTAAISMGYSSSELWMGTIPTAGIAAFYAFGISGNNPILSGGDGFYRSSATDMLMPGANPTFKDTLPGGVLKGASACAVFGRGGNSFESGAVAVFNGRSVIPMMGISGALTSNGISSAKSGTARQSDSTIWSMGSVFNNGQRSMIKRIRMA